MSNDLIAQKIIQEDGFYASDGNWQKLTSNIDYEEMLFLYEIIKEHKPKKSLEIGCAEGVSSLTICESLPADAVHTIIDPFQSSDWKNHGVNNLKRAGFDNFNLIEERSEFVLPDLTRKGEKFDFVFVDGWHTFDHVLVEFFYINRILNTGGVVVFDDTSLTGLNRLMRWISNYPNYECLGSTGAITTTTKRATLEGIKRLLNVIFIPAGKRIREELLDDTVIRSDSSLKINGSMTAFRKIGEDKRDWAWYKPF